MTHETDTALRQFLESLTELVKLAAKAVRKELERDGK